MFKWEESNRDRILYLLPLVLVRETVAMEVVLGTVLQVSELHVWVCF